MRPNFKLCEKLATELLLTSGVREFPIHVQDLTYKNPIVFDSMQNYCLLTGIPYESLVPNGYFKDGFNIVRSDVSVILFNKDVITSERINWTLGHEVGHTILEHKEDNDVEEVEANFFTANLFMPGVVLRELLQRGVSISSDLLIHTFGVSPEAAEKKIVTLRKNYWRSKRSFYRSGELLNQFQDFISRLIDLRHSNSQREAYDSFIQSLFL